VDEVVDLLAMDGDFLGRVDAEADLIAADLDDGDGDVVVDNNRLVRLAGQNEHDKLLSKTFTSLNTSFVDGGLNGSQNRGEE